MEDSKIMDKIGKFGQYLEQNILPDIMQFAQHKSTDIEENCYQGNKNNGDKYAQCLQAGRKKVEKELNLLEYKIIFQQKSLYQCYKDKTYSDDQCWQNNVDSAKKIKEDVIYFFKK